MYTYTNRDCQKNFMRNDQKNNGQNFWEILERIIGKISSIIGAGLASYSYTVIYVTSTCIAIIYVCTCIAINSQLLARLYIII